MEIKTKYNIGDKVIIYDRKEILEGVVSEINPCAKSEGVDIRYVISCDTFRQKGEMHEINECFAYKEKEELSEYLKERVDNLFKENERRKIWLIK